MSRATAILNRVNKALTKVTPTGRVLYKRVATSTGDTLIGKTSTSYVDTLLVPQPAVEEAGRERFSGAKDPVETVISSDGNRTVLDDYILTMSASAISAVELANPNLYFMFVDSSGNKEMIYIMDYSPIEFQGTVITFQIYARSVQSP